MTKESADENVDRPARSGRPSDLSDHGLESVAAASEAFRDPAARSARGEAGGGHTLRMITAGYCGE